MVFLDQPPGDVLYLQAHLVHLLTDTCYNIKLVLPYSILYDRMQYKAYQCYNRQTYFIIGTL